MIPARPAVQRLALLACLLATPAAICECAAPRRAPPVAAPVHEVPPCPVAANPPPMNAVRKMFGTASSEDPELPLSRAIDRQPYIPWFTADNDSAARGKSPFFEVKLAVPARISRVIVYRNSDCRGGTGCSILAGRLDLVAVGGARIFSREAKIHAWANFSFDIPEGLAEVEVARFTSLEDQGAENPHGHVSIGSFLLL